MKKKWFFRVTTVCVLAAFIVLTHGCATTEEKKAMSRIDILTKNGGSAMFAKPPLEGETVLGNFTSQYSDLNSGSLPKVIADIYRNFNGLTPYHKQNPFSARTGAGFILAEIVKKNPDINVDNLDVRSLVHTGTTYSINVSTYVDTKTNTCSFMAWTTYRFSGVVVELP